MGLRSSLLFELSRRRLPPPAVRTVDYGAYQDWRRSHLAASWSAFAAADLRGKEVLDFGCGDGPLSLYLANSQLPARIIGVDLDPIAVGRARAALAERPAPSSVEVEFRQGTVDRVPLDDCAVDFVVAFDCLEHVMDPLNILREWHRVGDLEGFLAQDFGRTRRKFKSFSSTPKTNGPRAITWSPTNAGAAPTSRLRSGRSMHCAALWRRGRSGGASGGRVLLACAPEQ
jgi:ubiquinone/menaquinone biosynthesis C-methylase UbiE